MTIYSFKFIYDFHFGALLIDFICMIYFSIFNISKFNNRCNVIAIMQSLVTRQSKVLTTKVSVSTIIAYAAIFEGALCGSRVKITTHSQA